MGLEFRVRVGVGVRVGVSLAGELAVCDEELAEHMAGRQGHLAEVRRIPSRQDDASIVGLVLDLVDDLWLGSGLGVGVRGGGKGLGLGVGVRGSG